MAVISLVPFTFLCRSKDLFHVLQGGKGSNVERPAALANGGGRQERWRVVIANAGAPIAAFTGPAPLSEYTSPSRPLLRLFCGGPSFSGHLGRWRKGGACGLALTRAVAVSQCGISSPSSIDGDSSKPLSDAEEPLTAQQESSGPSTPALPAKCGRPRGQRRLLVDAFSKYLEQLGIGSADVKRLKGQITLYCWGHAEFELLRECLMMLQRLGMSQEDAGSLLAKSPSAWLDGGLMELVPFLEEARMEPKQVVECIKRKGVLYWKGLRERVQNARVLLARLWNQDFDDSQLGDVHKVVGGILCLKGSENADEWLAAVVDHGGIGMEEVRNLLVRKPKALSCKATTIQELLEVLRKDLKMDEEATRRAVKQILGWPHGCSPELMANIRLVIGFWREFGMKDADLRKWVPKFEFCATAVESTKETVDELLKEGFTPAEVAMLRTKGSSSHTSYQNLRASLAAFRSCLAHFRIPPELAPKLLASAPTLLGCRPATLQVRLAGLRLLEFSDEDIRKLLLGRPRVLLIDCKPAYEAVSAAVQAHGICEESCRSMVRKEPGLLALSPATLREKLDWIIYGMGYSGDDVIRSPGALLFSLTRLKDRQQALESAGLCYQPALGTIAYLSTKEFGKGLNRWIVKYGRRKVI